MNKQNLVPKDGKGKYDITVPDPPKFLKQKHEAERKLREEAECKVTFKANDIPKTTKQPLYQKILEE